MNILSALYSGKVKFLASKKAEEDRVEELRELLESEQLKKSEVDPGLDSPKSNTGVNESSKSSRR